MNKKIKFEKKDRREFLKLGLVAGGATIAGMAWPSSGKNNSGEKVKAMTTDGQIVEVDKESVGENYCHHQDSLSNTEIRKGIPGKKYVMVIDLSR